MVPLQLSKEMQAAVQSPEGTGGMVRSAGSVAFVASSRLGPRIMFAPPDAASAGGAGGQAGTGEGAAAGSADANAGAGSSGADAGAAGGASAGQAGAAAGAGAEKPVRPEWLPESFWDADKGFKKEDFDSLLAFKAERDSADASKPDAPEKFEVKLPESFKLPDHVKLPEGAAIINADDPRIAALQKVAHEKGWSQSDFEDVLAMGINLDIANEDRRVDLLNKERDKLGSRGKERVTAVTTWFDAKLGAELGGALKPMLFTAKQVEAFERLMQLNRGDVPGNPGANRVQSDPSKIDGFEKMSFRERVAAIQALKNQ